MKTIEKVGSSADRSNYRITSPLCPTWRNRETLPFIRESTSIKSQSYISPNLQLTTYCPCCINPCLLFISFFTYFFPFLHHCSLNFCPHNPVIRYIIINVIFILFRSSALCEPKFFQRYSKVACLGHFESYFALQRNSLTFFLKNVGDGIILVLPLSWHLHIFGSQL